MNTSSFPEMQWSPSCGLPKWPQMQVAGRPVALDQAKEIIRRTDQFFSGHGLGGNDEVYASYVRQILGCPDPCCSRDRTAWQQWDTWLSETWHFIYTDYVPNDWIASPYIFGPHGWCWPDGTICFTDNVGKWPSSQEVYQDWCVLARAFPFLELGVTLMDGECCSEAELQPVVSFLVQNGVVTSHDPAVRNVVKEYDTFLPTVPSRHLSLSSRASGVLSERGLPFSWIQEWGQRQKDLGNAL